MFCLYYDAATKKVSAMNGSGRSGAKSSLKQVRSDLGLADDDRHAGIPLMSVHAVTVPGAAAGWVDAVERFGSGNVALEKILDPAARLGEEGFPVSELTSYYACAPLRPKKLERPYADCGFSGKRARNRCGNSHQTSGRCSRQIQAHQMGAAAPNQGT
jgi:gamma-glutamyltranspeptidase